MTPPPFTVIGGYLGAGKTTLVNHLLTEAHGLRVAVLVNDFGEVNVDAALIASHDGDTMSLANGCMCCSLTNGFAQAINAVLERQTQMDAIVIEASGVAEPGRIAQYGQMYELPLDGVITVADAELIREQAANKYVGEVVMHQLAQADIILLNKSDRVEAETLGDVRRWLASAAPGIPVLETVRSNVPLDILIGRGGSRQATPSVALRFTSAANHEALHRTWVIRRTAPVRRVVVSRLAQRMGSRIFRAKGFVNLAEDPERRYLLQQVGQRWVIEEAGRWDPGAVRTEIVCIGPHNS